MTSPTAPIPNNPAGAESTLKTLLPELYALRQVTENNGWHTDDPFHQSLRLRQWLAELPASLVDLGLAPGRLPLSRHLSARVDPGAGIHTTQALLEFVALIHDVGKKETFGRRPDGTTRCPGHEVAGARLAGPICARFDLTPIETGFITTLVKTHGRPYALFKETAGLSAAQQQDRICRFEQQHAAYLCPLLLLACGDLVTSHLPLNRPARYEAVRRFYRDCVVRCSGWIAA